MSLKDDLESIQMTQTRDYREQGPSSPVDVESSTNDSSTSTEDNSGRKSVPNPFKREGSEAGSGLPEAFKNPKVVLIGVGAIIVIILLIVIIPKLTAPPEDEGAGFLTELEEVGTFQYTLEERETLRINGYTADDIERFEVEQADPYVLVEEATEQRRLLLEEEMKPLLDGASPKYKELEAMTWLGTGAMSKEAINNVEGTYEERYGTYNCDYIKVDPHGAQLFVKLTLKEFNNQSIFMTMTPTRYNELDTTGNIVVVIEYNKYADGSILVTDVQEKDIVN